MKMYLEILVRRSLTHRLDFRYLWMYHNNRHVVRQCQPHIYVTDSFVATSFLQHSFTTNFRRYSKFVSTHFRFPESQCPLLVRGTRSLRMRICQYSFSFPQETMPAIGARHTKFTHAHLLRTAVGRREKSASMNYQN